MSAERHRPADAAADRPAPSAGSGGDAPSHTEPQTGPHMTSPMAPLSGSAARRAADGTVRHPRGHGLALVALLLSVVAVAVAALPIVGPRWIPGWDLVGATADGGLTAPAARGGQDIIADDALSSGGGAPGIDALAHRVARLELAGSGPDPDASGSAALQVPRLAEQVATLDGTLSETALDVAALQPLSGRVQVVEHRINALAQQPATDPRDVARLNTLEQQLRALQAALDGIDQALQQAEALAERVDTLAAALTAAEAADDVWRQQVETLADDLGGLSGTATRLDGALATLAEEVDRLRLAGTDGQLLLLGLTRIRDAYDQGQPYTQPLANLTTAIGADEALLAAIAPLADHAGNGVPSHNSLLASFDAMARDARDAAIEAEGTGWGDRARATFNDLVTIRPAPGEVDGTDMAAALARAEHRLLAGDLDGTVDALHGLDEAPREAARDWIAAAEARLAVRDALASATALVVQRATAGLNAVPIAVEPGADPTDEATNQPAPAGAEGGP